MSIDPDDQIADLERLLRPLGTYDSDHVVNATALHLTTVQGAPVRLAAVYRTTREYGGPEEGGWWWTSGQLISLYVLDDAQHIRDTELEALRERYPRARFSAHPSHEIHIHDDGEMPASSFPDEIPRWS